MAYGATACERSPHCETRAIPEFASVVTSAFLLDNLKHLSGIPTLVAVPSGAESTAGYAFALPGSENPEGESYVVTIDYSPRPRSNPGTGWSDVSVHGARGPSCMKDFRHLPPSAGTGGSYRAVAFTTIDAGYDVQVGVFEKLKETTASQPLDLERFSSIIAQRYCSAWIMPTTLGSNPKPGLRPRAAPISPPT
jgi:hypothetical protein